MSRQLRGAVGSLGGGFFCFCGSRAVGTLGGATGRVISGTLGGATGRAILGTLAGATGRAISGTLRAGAGGDGAGGVARRSTLAILACALRIGVPKARVKKMEHVFGCLLETIFRGERGKRNFFRGRNPQ
jgi:hypothetical protein